MLVALLKSDRPDSKTHKEGAGSLLRPVLPLHHVGNPSFCRELLSSVLLVGVASVQVRLSSMQRQLLLLLLLLLPNVGCGADAAAARHGGGCPGALC